MLRILDPPMTTHRRRQPLAIGLQATDEVADLYRLLPLTLHHRDHTTDTAEVAPCLAIAQVLGDRRGDVGPVLQPTAILLLGGVELRAGQGLLVLEHPVEV